jgi:hypothetical protein
LLVLEDPVNPFEEIRRLSSATYEIELEHDVLIGLVPVSVEAYEDRASPLIQNAREDSVPA